MKPDIERRKEENSIYRILYGQSQGVEKILLDVQREVQITNGRVTVVEGKLGEHESKFEQLGLSESFKKGYRRGKVSMKTSTRNNILMTIAIAGIILAATAYGTRQIRYYKADQISNLKRQVIQAETYYRQKNSTTEGLPWDKH